MPRLGDLGYLWHHKAAFTRLPPLLHFIWYKTRPPFMKEGKFMGMKACFLVQTWVFLAFVCLQVYKCPCKSSAVGISYTELHGYLLHRELWALLSARGVTWV